MDLVEQPRVHDSEMRVLTRVEAVRFLEASGATDSRPCTWWRSRWVYVAARRWA